MMRLMYTKDRRETLGWWMPWWMRPWRENFMKDEVSFAVIPLCWLLRGIWNFWTWTYVWRPNAYEKKITEAVRGGRLGEHIAQTIKLTGIYHPLVNEVEVRMPRDLFFMLTGRSANR